jgi:hypothetical protein
MGKFSLNFEKLDLNLLVHEVANLIRIQVQLRPSVTFELHLKPSSLNQRQMRIEDDPSVSKGDLIECELEREFVTDG